MADATVKDLRSASKETATSPAATKPVATYRSGSVSVADFGDSVSVRRSYRTKAGEWKHSSTLWHRDIPHAIAALTKCIAASSGESDTDSVED